MAHKINDNGIDREMTTGEQSAHDAYAVIAIAEAQARLDAQTARAVAREALLTRLGITADEAQLLLGS